MALQEELEKQGNYLFRKRSNLPILILLVALVLYALKSFLEPYELPVFFPNPYEWSCLGVSMLGLIIRIYTVGYTPVNTSGRNTSEGQLADTLNTMGIYSVVRHPLYLGNFLMWLGIGMFTENPWFIIAFVFIYWVYYERIMFAEEAFLRRKFGDAYLEWATKTPAFIPAFRRIAKSSIAFSWKKVLKKEKNGLFALFLVIYLFKFVSFSIKNFTFYFSYDFWFYAMASTGVLYLILKILKRSTRIFDEEGR